MKDMNNGDDKMTPDECPTCGRYMDEALGVCNHCDPHEHGELDGGEEDFSFAGDVPDMLFGISLGDNDVV